MNPDELLAFDFHSFGLGADVDGEAASASGLSADRAIAKLIGVILIALNGKLNSVALA